MESKWNKDLDIPIEVLFKYLYRDYRREQARNDALTKQVKQLQARINYGENCLPPVEKLQKQVENFKAINRDLQLALSRRNIEISQLNEINYKLKKRLEKYEEV